MKKPYHYDNNTCIPCAQENLTVYIVQHLWNMNSYPRVSSLLDAFLYKRTVSAFNTGFVGGKVYFLDLWKLEVCNYACQRGKEVFMAGIV